MRISALTISALLAVAAPVLSNTAAASGDHEGGHAGHSFGEPAPDAQPDRVVEITAADTMDFDPSRIEVKAGQVVRFEINNTGSLHHSFTLGSSEWHHQHEEEMQGMAVDKIVTHMRDEPNGVVVPPGESRTLVWKFTGSGTVQFGCHVPGHWPAGMKGEIDLG